MKWGLVLAGISDFARPAENLSLTQNGALTATGIIWTRWCLIIKPKNYLYVFPSVFTNCTDTKWVSVWRRSTSSWAWWVSFSAAASSCITSLKRRWSRRRRKRPRRLFRRREAVMRKGDSVVIETFRHWSSARDERTRPFRHQESSVREEFFGGWLYKNWRRVFVTGLVCNLFSPMATRGSACGGWYGEIGVHLLSELRAAQRLQL